MALFWKMKTIVVAPMSPRPTQNRPGDAAGAEGDLERRRQVALAGCGRRAHVAADRQAHPDEAGEPGEGGAAQEGDGPGEAGLHEGQGDGAVGADDLGGGEEHEDEQRDDDDGDRLELPAQEGLGALLDGAGDLSHLVRARVGGEHAAHQVQGGRDRHDASGEGEDKPAPLGSAEREGLIAAIGREEMGKHYLLLWSGRVGGYGRRRADSNHAIGEPIMPISPITGPINCQRPFSPSPSREAKLGL